MSQNKSRFDGVPNNEVLAEGRKIVQAIKDQTSRVVYGPELEALIDMMIMALLADSHVVVRAPIGLGKTLACNALAQAIGGVFNKHQFRPDMLPSHLSGFEFYNQKNQDFEVRHGPLYRANVFLADEINRGTPKVQSALLEAMEERYLTIGTGVYKLEPVFMVLATRNPMEHEGTYQLPEAQLDRFFAQPVIEDISEETGMLILGNSNYWRPPETRLKAIKAVTNPAEIIDLREAIFSTIHVEPGLDRYIWRIIAGTKSHPDVDWGSSPRGAINLKKTATVSAFLAGRDFAQPEADVEEHAVDVLAHRIFLEPQARYNGKSAAQVIREVLSKVSHDEREKCLSSIPHLR